MLRWDAVKPNLYNQKTTLGILNTYVTMLASGNSLINDAKDQGVGIDFKHDIYFNYFYIC